MPNESNKLYLYEALELRAEYNRKISIFENLKPEKVNGPYGISNMQPVDNFDPSELNSEIRKNKFKLRKLNSAIQKANYENTVKIEGEEITLMEALDFRKSVSEDIDQIISRLQTSAYKNVEHLDSRSVVSEPQEDYKEVYEEAMELMNTFRDLNRAIRKASFEIVLDFHDEPRQ